MNVSTGPGRSADSDFCQTFKIGLPLVGAPMAGATGPELAAAVANAGGLAFLQSARLPPAQVIDDYKTAIGLLDAGKCPSCPVEPPLPKNLMWLLSQRHSRFHRLRQRPAGVPVTSIGLGFINWQMTDEALDAAISCRAAVVWLAFPSDGREFAALLPHFKAAGSKVVCMVQTLDEAEEVVSSSLPRGSLPAIVQPCALSRPVLTKQRYRRVLSCDWSTGSSMLRCDMLVPLLSQVLKQKGPSQFAGIANIPLQHSGSGLRCWATPYAGAAGGGRGGGAEQ